MNAKLDRAVDTGTRIAAGDDRTRYDDVSILLHWITVALVIFQFGIAQVWDFFDKPTNDLMVAAHTSFGLLLAAVLLTRIAWRLTPGHKVASVVTGWVELASRGVHYLLYGLLAAEVVLGFIFGWARPHEPLIFFGLAIPSPLGAFSRAARHQVGQIHEWVGWTIVIVATGHAAAALYHHFALHDRVLVRMLPGRAAAAKSTPTA